MAAMVAVCFLSGVGLLSLVWAALGWLLPWGQGAVLVCAGLPDEGILSRYRWLRGLGLLRCPLVAVTEVSSPAIPNDIETIDRHALLRRLEQEWEICHGTGTGDPSGHHRCGGVSEL